MKGIIFNVVEDAVTAEHGDEVWDALLAQAGVDGAFTALGDYPDSHLTGLVEAGAAALGTSPDELTRRLGHSAVAGLASRYPHFFAPHASARPFLLTLNDVIHAEARKLHAGATPPELWFDDEDPELLVVNYRSDRGLCTLAEGMIAGTATWFGEVATVEQVRCMRDGHDHCVLHARFAAPA